MKSLLRLSFFLFFSTLVIISCNSNSGSGIETPNDRAEQLIVDDNLIREYLSTHTYNYEDFQDSSNQQVEIVIDTISESNASKTPLLDLVETIQVPVVDADDNEILHTLYYIVARQGSEIERKPSIIDSVFVGYTGKLLNDTQFDQQKLPVWFDSVNVITGFRYGLQNFAPGSYTVNQDGTYTFENYGQGILIIPSGLGYFNITQGAIPAYSPLVFLVSVFTTNQSDHDNDGVLSIDEDADGDGNPYNDDTDQDNISNYLDIDDDGDGILTKDEYDVNLDGIPDDTDGDGIPDYLDND